MNLLIVKNTIKSNNNGQYNGKEIISKVFKLKEEKEI